MPFTKIDNLFSHKMHVRIDDINFGNHLCHSKFINFLHNTRALFLKAHNLSEVNCFGCGLIMLNLNISYLSQCFFNDLLEITLGVNDIARATITFSYSIYNHTTNQKSADATTLMGFLDLEKNKLKSIPADFSNLLEDIKKDFL